MVTSLLVTTLTILTSMENEPIRTWKMKNPTHTCHIIATSLSRSTNQQKMTRD